MGGIYSSSNEDRYFESLVDREIDRRDWREGEVEDSLREEIEELKLEREELESEISRLEYEIEYLRGGLV